MKMTKLMIAVAALAGVAQANATGIVRLTGSSASSTNVVRGLYNACTAGGGTTTVYKTSSATNSLGNQVTVTCSKNFDGTTGGTATNEVRINVAGGSASAVTATTATGTNFLVGSGSCTALAAGTESLSFLGAGILRNCGTTLSDTGNLSDGGFLDVDPAFFGLSQTASASGFSQVFGVALNDALYKDLQAYQKTVAGNGPSGKMVDPSCAVGATTPACQPSLTKAQIASLINNDLFTVKGQGGDYLIPSSFPAASRPSGYTGGNIKLAYCMRPQTSGTQQSAQLYFLGYALNGPQGGNEIIVGQNVTNGNYSSILGSGTGNVKNCLNDTNQADGSAIPGAPSATTSGYRIGVLSLENNPIGGSDKFRFARINEVEAAEGVAGSSQTASAISGRYDMVFELVTYTATSKGDNAINTLVIPNIGAGNSSPGIFLTGVEGLFSRNGNNAGVYLQRF